LLCLYTHHVVHQIQFVFWTSPILFFFQIDLLVCYGNDGFCYVIDYSVTWFQFRNVQWHKNCCSFIPTMWSTKCNSYFQLFPFYFFSSWICWSVTEMTAFVTEMTIFLRKWFLKKRHFRNAYFIVRLNII